MCYIHILFDEKWKGKTKDNKILTKGRSIVGNELQPSNRVPSDLIKSSASVEVP